MSLVLSADGQNLDSGNSTTLWTGAQSFTLAVWFKKASGLDGSLFGVIRSDYPTVSNACLRFSNGIFDHGMKIANADMRMDDSGALTSGWDLAVLTVNDVVEVKSYFNGTLKNTKAIPGLNWGGPADRIIVGNHTLIGWDTGRGKIAHAALWDTVLSAAQVADLWNGGAGGAGKSPTAVARANLRTYLPLISNATDETGTFTLTATGAPAYDAADNPNVEASGPADTTAPSLSGALTVSNKTGTGYTVSWPAATDDVAVTGYEYRINGGAWTATGNVLTVNIIGRSPGTDAVELRAFDAAGNRSSALSVNVVLAPVAITSPPLKNNTGTLLASSSGWKAYIYVKATGAWVSTMTGSSTDAAGVMTLPDSALVAGNDYRVVVIAPDGGEGLFNAMAA